MIALWPPPPPQSVIIQFVVYPYLEIFQVKGHPTHPTPNLILILRIWSAIAKRCCKQQIAHQPLTPDPWPTRPSDRNSIRPSRRGYSHENRLQHFSGTVPRGKPIPLPPLQGNPRRGRSGIGWGRDQAVWKGWGRQGLPVYYVGLVFVDTLAIALTHLRGLVVWDYL